MKKSFKKFLLTVTFAVFGLMAANAQELGVRFGDVSGGNVALDAVFSTGDFSRIHADVSFGNGVGVDVLWDFLYRPLGSDDFRWYAGVGPYAWFDDPLWLGAVGELGLEYRFPAIPISLSLDWRPSFSIIDETEFNAGGFGLNVRFIFN